MLLWRYISTITGRWVALSFARYHRCAKAFARKNFSRDPKAVRKES